MNTAQYSEKLNLEVISAGESREVTGCYIGDLLSWVMGRAATGQAWITVMSNANVAAVASMAEVACVILCDGARPDEALTQKARLTGLPLFASELSAYELAKLTAALI